MIGVLECHEDVRIVVARCGESSIGISEHLPETSLGSDGRDTRSVVDHTVLGEQLNDLHDLTAGVGGALPAEDFGDSLDLEAGGAGAPHLRLEGTGRHCRPSIPVHDLSSLWMFAPPPTSVIAVNPTAEER